MAWFIEVTDGPDRGMKAALSAGQIVVGRSPGAGNFTLTDAGMSRQHARIISAAGGVFQVEDLNSSNGTFVNKQKVNGAVQIRPGDTIIMGNNRFALNWLDGAVSSFQGSYRGAAAQAIALSADEPLSISKALAAPFNGIGFIKLILGAFLAAIPVAEFFAGGYRYRLLEKGNAGEIDMPEWDDFGDLFLKGLYIFFVKVIYLLLPVALLLIMVYIITQSDLSKALQAMGLSIGLFLMLLSGFFMPMAWAHFAARGDLASAFQLGEVLDRIKAVFSQYMTALLLFAALWILMILLALIPGIGWVLVILGFFYVQVVSAFLFGEVYQRSRAVLN